MQRYNLKKGTTSKILLIDIYDSASTVGARLAGLVFNTASLTAFYNREGAAGAAVAITLATATKGTWATGGFVAIDATNMPGHYELHLPDAALATGANAVLIELKGAANMVPKTILIELVAYDAQDAVRLGLTALPNVASGSAGAIPTTGVGANQLSVASGLVTLAGVTHTGAVIPTVTALTNDAGITQVGADKVWASATRTLTAFSTALALSVWDVLESAIATASSIGLKLKTNLDVVVSTRATPAEVKTQVVDALATDTYAEPVQGAPAATTTLAAKINYLYKAFRNRKRQTATLWELMNDAETVVDHKATVSDDATTAIKQKIVSGP